MNKVPIPPAFMAVCLTGQYLLTRHRRVTMPSVMVASVVCMASGALTLGALREFRRHGTSFDPVEVHAPTSLVVSGPNRLTRNPMYVGLAGLLAAHGILRHAAVAVVPMATFVVVIDRLQIPAEEAALAEKFGDDYSHYCRSVPRWVNRRTVRAFLGR